MSPSHALGHPPCQRCRDRPAASSRRGHGAARSLRSFPGVSLYWGFISVLELYLTLLSASFISARLGSQLGLTQVPRTQTPKRASQTLLSTDKPRNSKQWCRTAPQHRRGCSCRHSTYTLQGQRQQQLGDATKSGLGTHREGVGNTGDAAVAAYLHVINPGQLKAAQDGLCSLSQRSCAW